MNSKIMRIMIEPRYFDTNINLLIKRKLRKADLRVFRPNQKLERRESLQINKKDEQKRDSINLKRAKKRLKLEMLKIKRKSMNENRVEKKGTAAKLKSKQKAKFQIFDI